MSDFNYLIGQKINGTGERVIKSVLQNFKVLWYSWECDSDAAVVELNDGEKGIIITDHGSPLYTTGDSATKFLADKSAEYLELVKNYSEITTILYYNQKLT